MTVARYALVDARNVVVNNVMWDGKTTTWSPPEGLTPVKLGDNSLVAIGDAIDANGAVVSKAIVPPEQVNAAVIGAWLDSLITQGENVVANWGSVTAVQKDAAAKQVVQAVTRLARLARNNLGSAGA